MSKYRSRRWLLSVGAVVLLTVVVGSVALGQLARRTPGMTAATRIAEIRTGLFIPGMRELKVQLPPARAAAITQGKQAANLNVLRSAYFTRDNIPHLRISADRAVKLMPLETMEGAPPSQRETTAFARLPTAMRKYSSHLNLRAIGKVVSPIIPPSSVDHRGNQTSIKDQDDRGTCVAFASMAGMEAKYGGGSLDLSEQDAYHRFMRQASRTCCYNYGLKTTDSADYLKAHAVCRDTYWPYVSYGGLGCPISNGNAHRPSAASTNAKYKIKTFRKIWRNESLTTDTGTWINNPKYLEALLHFGSDIVFGTHVAGWSWPVTGVVDVQLSGGEPLPSEGGHAMLMVGYDRPGQYFILKNSWGSGCGQSGYVYLSYDYIRTYSKYGYVIDSVEPIVYRLKPMVMKRPVFVPRRR
ncbi:MAG: C1 family peptidase [Armatimonadota bacterium]